MSDTKNLLRENTLRLLAAEGQLKSNETGISRLVAKGIGQGTAQRILEGKTSIGLDTLEQLAFVLGVSPWRLLQPLDSKVATHGPSAEANAKKPSASSIEMARVFDALPAAERTAIKTILNGLASSAKS